MCDFFIMCVCTKQRKINKMKHKISFGVRFALLQHQMLWGHEINVCVCECVCNCVCVFGLSLLYFEVLFCNMACPYLLSAYLLCTKAFGMFLFFPSSIQKNFVNILSVNFIAVAAALKRILTNFDPFRFVGTLFCVLFLVLY